MTATDMHINRFLQFLELGSDSNDRFEKWAMVKIN